MCNNLIPLERSAFLNSNVSIQFSDSIVLNNTEKNLISVILQSIIHEQKDYKSFVCDLDFLSVSLNLQKDVLESELNVMCANLLRKVVKIESLDKRNNWTLFHCLSFIEYKDEKLTVKLSDDMIPYILVFNENLISTEE